MPVVPIFADPQNQVQQQALPNASVITQAPDGAFGGGATGEKLGNAMANLGSTVSEVAQKERDAADQVASVQADTAASKLQTQIQVQVSKMKGEDALQAPDYVDKTWQDGVDDIRGNLNGRNQQLAFDRATAARYQELNKSVQLHVAGESENLADQTFAAGIQQSRDSAVVNAGDGDKVNAELGWQTSLVKQQAARKGIPEDSDAFKQMLTQQLSATHQDVVLAQIDAGLTKPAQEYFDAHKDQMAAGDILHVQGALENAQVVSESNEMFQDVLKEPGMKFSDGTINGEAVRKYIEENSDLSDQKTLKILSQVKAQAKEYNIDRYHQISQTERQFTNDVVVARQNGQPLSQAMLSVGKYATDPYDAALKTQFVQKTYAPSEETQVLAWEGLREGIQSGTTEMPAIDAAFKNGSINVQDYAKLRELKLKTAADGTDPNSKYYNGLITNQATKAFGNDKEAMAQFQYVLALKSEGKSPQEKLAIAQDELKKVPDPNAYFWGKTQQFKLDATQMQGQDTALGGIYKDVGYQQAQAMASGFTQSNPNSRIKDPSQGMHQFASSIGLKYEDLKTGQPANNAIQSLISKGKQVTTQAVPSVLKIFPDGNWK